MKLLITGGSGFIAQAFFQYLTTLPKEEAPEIRLFDRSFGQDLTNWEKVDEGFREFQPTHVINFASLTHIDTSIKDPRLFWTNNLGLQINVLEACRKYNSRLLQISSSEVYGTAKFVPITEEHPLNPHSPYAATKVMQDRATYSWWQTYGLDASIVRPFNQYGAGQQLEKMIPKAITLIRDGKSIPVYGAGVARRDWLYVRDTARGLWLALTKLPAGDVVNLATNKSYSTLELVEVIKEVMGSLGYKDLSQVVTVQHTEDRFGHVMNLQASYAKAKEVLGWEPKYDLRAGIRETALWVLNSDWGLVSR